MSVLEPALVWVDGRFESGFPVGLLADGTFGGVSWNQ